MSSHILILLLLIVCFASIAVAQRYPYGPHYGYGYHNAGYHHGAGHYHPRGYGYNRGGSGYLAGVFTGMLLRG